MNEFEPVNQIKLFGLDKFIKEFIELDKKKILPNKILLSGQKGLGKSTLAYHLINYCLSKKEDFSYNINKFEINPENHSYKTVINKSNPNLIIIDIDQEKKTIDISQIRQLIFNLTRSSFNNKPRFVLIDNIEFLNVNSINALLKVLEEPIINVYFILVNNNKRVLPTLLSRCINFKINLSNHECLSISEKLLDSQLTKKINKDLINYYSTPGNIYNLYMFGQSNKYDLINTNLKQFLKDIIHNNYYKKECSIRYLIYDFVEFYFTKLNSNFSSEINSKYNYFLKKISNTKKYNLDEDSLFLEIEEEVLNG
jgi:DNA polymerase-3 subunit delta'